MPTFRVYEVQNEVISRKWMYEVEAPNEEDALNVVQAGEVDPIDCGAMGESLYAESGFTVQPLDADGDIGWEHAVKQLESIGEAPVASDRDH